MKILTWLVIPCLATGLARAADPELKLDLGGGVPLDLVLLKGGEFTQGSPESEAGRGGDESQRGVSISHDFYIGRTAVTRGQWERFVSETGFRSEAETGTSGGFGWDGNALVQKKQFTWRSPGFTQTGDHPVCLVTFPDAQAFCNWLERKTKRKITLPTEAQWEYACRAGTTTPWPAGTSAEEAAWHKGNSANSTHPVDSKPANPWGLVIGGNVSEWCLDWYAPYQPGAVTDPLQDNPNLSDKPRRVLRGGSWNRSANNTRSAARYRADPRSRNADTGFRIVCSVGVPAPPPVAVVPPAPKVEAEPGDIPRPPVPPMMPTGNRPIPMEYTPSSPSKIGSVFGGLLCILIPIGLIILLIRSLTRSAASPRNPFVAPLAPPVIPPQRIRKTADGFWVFGNWPAGTPLKVRYVVGGSPSAMNLIYQPGPEGQFVFTGKTADSISIVADGDDPLPPPISMIPTLLPDQFDSRPQFVSRPPRFPSAY